MKNNNLDMIDLEWLDSVKKKLNWIEVKTQKNLKKIDKIIKLENEIKNIIFKILNTSTNTKDEKLKIQFLKIKNTIFNLLNELKEDTLIINKETNKIKDNAEKAISYIESFYENINKDDLTGLYNRKFIKDLIDVLLDNKKSFNIIFIDIDNFKIINDTYGHLTGDNILQQFAKLLLLIFWNDNTYISRIYGDEFVIISFEDSQKLLKKINKVKQFIQYGHIKIKNEINKNKKIIFDFSFWFLNIQNKLQKYKNADEVLNDVDKLMYKNKKSKSS